MIQMLDKIMTYLTYLCYHSQRQTVIYFNREVDGSLPHQETRWSFTSLGKQIVIHLTGKMVNYTSLGRWIIILLTREVHSHSPHQGGSHSPHWRGRQSFTLLQRQIVSCHCCTLFHLVFISFLSDVLFSSYSGGNFNY